MLGAKVDLLHHGFKIVDAVESRQFYLIVGIVHHWKRLGKLPKDVVIGTRDERDRGCARLLCRGPCGGP